MSYTTLKDAELNLLFKKIIGVPDAFPGLDFTNSEAPGISKPFIVSSQIFQQTIPANAPGSNVGVGTAPGDLVQDGTFTSANSGGTRYVSSTYSYMVKYSGLVLQVVSSDSNYGYSYRYQNPNVGTNLTAQAIPSNFDVAKSSYGIILNDSTGNAISVNTYPWILDTDSGYLTFIDSTRALPIAKSPPSITFYRYEGTFGVGGTGGGGVIQQFTV